MNVKCRKRMNDELKKTLPSMVELQNMLDQELPWVFCYHSVVHGLRRKTFYLDWCCIRSLLENIHDLRRPWKKYLIHYSLLIIIIIIILNIYYYFIFSYLLLLMFYSRTCSHSCFRMLNTQKCLVRRNKWNYSSLFEMLMEINHIPFILTSSFT